MVYFLDLSNLAGHDVDFRARPIRHTSSFLKLLYELKDPPAFCKNATLVVEHQNFPAGPDVGSGVHHDSVADQDDDRGDDDVEEDDGVDDDAVGRDGVADEDVVGGGVVGAAKNVPYTPLLSGLRWDGTEDRCDPDGS